MDSIQTKSKKYVTLHRDKCVSQVVAIAEPDSFGFRIFVAWEWEKMAKKGVFGFTESTCHYSEVSKEAIQETMNYGRDVSMEPKVKTIFKNLF